jgi:hypothetical protein
VKRSNIVVILAVAALATSAPGDVIPGFQIGLNDTGYNVNFPSVYLPITSSAGGAPGSSRWKAEYVDRFIADMKPKSGRHMDYTQTVSNETTNWANRSMNDFDDKGITYESLINIDNQALAVNPNYRPWLNSPIFADEAHDEEWGYLYGTRYPGKTIYVGKGNEGWAIFGDNLPARQMRAAIAAGETGGSDFEKAGRAWGKRLGRSVEAFKRGLARAGRFDVRVVMAVEGFAPVTAWAQYQIDGMRSIGIEPAAHDAHVSIAQYAAGSPTDLVGPMATNEQKRIALTTFIANSLVPWTNQHRALARANGLADVVDAYEMRLGTYTPSADWFAFQGSPEMAAVQEYGWHALFEASGGAEAVLNAEGFYGFPWEAGIFSLANTDQFADPYASQAYAATRAQIDFASIPEPRGMLWVVLVVALIVWRNRR